VAEIRVHSDSGFYDFQAKYLPEEQVDLDVPAEIRPELPARSRASDTDFGRDCCEGLARVDVFVTHDGHVVVNEINTMPGFTPHSMFPRMWAASGVPYPELVERLITLRCDVRLASANSCELRRRRTPSAQDRAPQA
jgi:D-alanine-D-alanine ligase